MRCVPRENELKLRQFGFLTQTKTYGEGERKKRTKNDRETSFSPAYILLPLVLHRWGWNKRSSSALAAHIQYAFDNDEMTGSTRENQAEDVFLHAEAAFRIALGTKSATIEHLFPGGLTNPDKPLSKKRVYVVPQDRWDKENDTRTARIKTVEDLSGGVDLIGHLQEGMIVMSKKLGEVSVECVSPLWETNGDMIIVGTQVSRRAHARTVSLDLII